MSLDQILHGDFVLRLVIDLVSMLVLVRVIYFRTYRRSDLFLTFFAFNLAIFLIAFVLSSTSLSMGAAFGLFAVFSMLRYRTEGISTSDMTYLFLGIALVLMMSISDAAWPVLLAIAAFLPAFVFLLESGLLNRRELRQEVAYDNLALITPRRGQPCWPTFAAARGWR